MGVDGLTEVLGTDEGMVAAAFGDDTVNMLTIGRYQTADIISGEEENTLDAILLLGLEGDTALAFEEGAGSPGGAPEDTGGVGGSGHRVEVLVKLGGIDFLGFINGEKEIGSGTDNLGLRITGKELHASLAKQVHVALGGMPAAARAEAGIERTADAIHVVGGLRFEGGGNRDNFPANMGVTEEEPSKEVGLKLVLAGLTWEDDDKGEPKMVKDGFPDGKYDPALIGTEIDAAGGSPTDGVAADGLAHTEGKSRRALRIAD